MDQAKSTVEKKDLGLLAEKVAFEKQHLEEPYDTWLNLVQNNVPFHRRLEQVRLEEYFKDAMKLVNIDRDE